MKDWLVPILQITASIVSPFVAVWLARRQFVSQRWWERKEDAYRKLLENLSVISYHLGICWELEVGTRYLKQRDDEIRRYDLAKTEVETTAATGAYLVSEPSLESCQELHRGGWYRL